MKLGMTVGSRGFRLRGNGGKRVITAILPKDELLLHHHIRKERKCSDEDEIKQECLVRRGLQFRFTERTLCTLEIDRVLTFRTHKFCIGFRFRNTYFMRHDCHFPVVCVFNLQRIVLYINLY
jgi:hypothetical protein